MSAGLEGSCEIGREERVLMLLSEARKECKHFLNATGEDHGVKQKGRNSVPCFIVIYPDEVEECELG